MYVAFAECLWLETMATELKVSRRVEKELNQTKVIVRRLPPDFTEEKFLEQFSPFPTEK